MYLFYSGHCFSQWFHSPFIGKLPKCVSKSNREYCFYNCEQWMMFNKAILFNDLATANKIMATKDPSRIKRLGRLVADFDCTQWNRVKVEIVVLGNILKFSQNPKLLNVLINTEGIIAEASPYDKIWGIGLSANDPRSGNIKTWKGLNLLGYALVRVRDYLKSKGANVVQIVFTTQF